MKGAKSSFFIIIVFSGLFFSHLAEAQPPKYDRSSPSFVIAQLYSVYMNKDFRRALDFTTGKERKKVQDILAAMNRNFGRPPVHVMQFLSKIQELRIIDEKVVDDKYARVDVIWVLRIKDKDNREDYQMKVNEVGYLLEKQKNLWLIRDTKFLKQHVFYDYASLQEKYRKALPFKPQNESR